MLELIGIKDTCCKKESNLQFIGMESSNEGFVHSRARYQCTVCNRVFHTEWFSQLQPDKAVILNRDEKYGRS